MVDDEWIGLAYCLGTLSGAQGAVLGYTFAPTESFKYFIEVLERVFARAVALGLPAPEDLYVDDAIKYEVLVLQVVKKFWANALTRIGQDVWHAIMLLTTCLDRYHPDYQYAPFPPLSPFAATPYLPSPTLPHKRWYPAALTLPPPPPITLTLVGPADGERGS